MLNNTSKGGSAAMEILMGLVVIAAISVSVYHLQHPHLTQQQQILQSIGQ